jgi:hypothetical protein
MTEFMQSIYYLPQAEFDTLSFQNINSPFKDPYIKQTLKVKSNKYASITGNRLFCHLDPTEKDADTSDNGKSRKQSIYIASPTLSDLDLDIILPEGYQIEALPQLLNVTTLLGKICETITSENTKLHYHKHVERYSGTFPVSAYEDLIKFQHAIKDICGQKIVLVKK